MAVNLLGSVNARIDFGDVSAVDSLTQMSVAISCKWSSAAALERLCTKWSGSAAHQNFSMSYTGSGSNNIQFVTCNGSFAYDEIRTTDNRFTSGSWHRILCRWQGNRTGDDITAYMDGTLCTHTVTSDGSFTTVPNSSSSVQVGHETAESIDGIDGDFAEFAVWNRWLDDAEAAAVTGLYSPMFFRRGMVLYAPLLNTSDLQDWAGGVVGTNSSGTNSSDHPRVIYPTSQKKIFVPSAAPPATSILPFVNHYMLG